MKLLGAVLIASERARGALSMGLFPGKDDVTVCWQPLLEFSATSPGFSYYQQHVTPHIGEAQAFLSEFPSEHLPPPTYDYTAETDLLEARLMDLDSISKAEIAFFDAKLNIAFGLLANLLLAQGS